MFKSCLQAALTSYFSDILDELLAELNHMLQLERKQLLIQAHKLLHLTVNFAKDEEEEGITPPPDVFQYPDVAVGLGEGPQELLTNARERVGRFFVREGNTFRFATDDQGEDVTVTNIDMQAVLSDLEFLDVHLRAAQARAAEELQRAIAENIGLLAHTLTVVLPLHGATAVEDLDLARQQLESMEKAASELQVYI